MFFFYVIWFFGEDVSCIECFIYVDMFIVVDIYFNSVQFLEFVFLVFELRIE